MSLTIKIKYLDPDMPRITEIEKGDWIDLCTTEYVQMEPGKFKLIPLGVIIQIPEGYEALLLPRSSTFKKYGILVANSMGVIDNSYRGPEDQWMLAAFGTKYIEIPKYARIAQFRIIRNQPKIIFTEIDEVTDASRGGFGSTGDGMVLNYPKKYDKVFEIDIDLEETIIRSMMRTEINGSWEPSDPGEINKLNRLKDKIKVLLSNATNKSVTDNDFLDALHTTIIEDLVNHANKGDIFEYCPTMTTCVRIKIV